MSPKSKATEANEDTVSKSHDQQGSKNVSSVSTF